MRKDAWISKILKENSEMECRYLYNGHIDNESDIVICAVPNWGTKDGGCIIVQTDVYPDADDFKMCRLSLTKPEYISDGINTNPLVLNPVQIDTLLDRLGKKNLSYQQFPEFTYWQLALYHINLSHQELDKYYIEDGIIGEPYLPLPLTLPIPDYRQL